MKQCVGQFQVQMEDCLLSRDSSHLVSLLYNEGLTSTTLTKLNQLVTKCLHGSEFSKVQVVLKSLESLSGSRDDLQTLLSHGLTAKVVLWFEAVRDSLTSDLKGSDSLTDLTEEFYDYFLAIRTFNSILESLSREQRRVIQDDRNQDHML
ncbi:hypothetical protein INR49_029206 [Caranx melampygus]|nr:hypothetical protein INR49_029206 [Caranx melampygus]